MYGSYVQIVNFYTILLLRNVCYVIYLFTHPTFNLVEEIMYISIDVDDRVMCFSQIILLGTKCGGCVLNLVNLFMCLKWVCLYVMNKWLGYQTCTYIRKWRNVSKGDNTRAIAIADIVIMSLVVNLDNCSCVRL